MVQIKRIYEDPALDDGKRVLVDRLWPRGVTKDRANLDLWLKEIAPSAQLRIWFGHKPDRFAEFGKRYQQELAHNPALAALKTLIAKEPKVTLLYAAKDSQINHAVVLQRYLEKDAG
jgi:uncharacterized protein YeaO (DUF488 family)